MPLTPTERRLRSRLAALSQHAAGKTNTGPARAALRQQFEDQVDPDRLLPEPERARRAELARRAHYARLALRSATVRRLRRERAARAAESAQ